MARIAHRTAPALAALLFALAMLMPIAVLAEGHHGLLLLAHGSHAAHASHGAESPRNVWNDNVEQLAARMNARLPTEVAFGMADPETMQDAIDRLQQRGIDDIAVVPLFVSSHSPIIGNFRYILGLQPELAKTSMLRELARVRSDANFRFAGAMDAHPLISEILLERARAVTDDPSATGVILIAHGPNDEGENRLWLRDMEAHAAFLLEQGGFRSVRFLTHRNDASAEVKDGAREELRQRVAEAAQDGAAVVVPVLLSAGGIEPQIEADLEGLPHRFARPLMPHPNIERWVEARSAELFADGL
jgi:sirohydrochlorin ferrochelatase